MATSVQLSTLESQAHVGKTVSRCVKAPLVEFHQRLKDTACSKQFHLFCKKRDPSFSHLLLFRAFGAAFGVPISGFLPMWLICKAFNRLCRSCTGRMLERFQLLQGEAGNLYSTGTQFLSGGLFESLKVLHWSFCSEV